MGYVDANYAGDLGDRRSTIYYVFTLEGRLICWKSIAQSLVGLSTNEVDKKALWLAGLVKELGIQQDGVQLHYNSYSAIYLANKLM